MSSKQETSLVLRNKDGFIWKDVTGIAIDLWKTGVVELYTLNGDTDSLIDCEEALDELLNDNSKIYMEVGYE